MNQTKRSISIMFTGTATGKVLAPYIVFKVESMWGSWCNGGPKDLRYNRSKSGWFDICFSNWFNTVILPYCRLFDGPKLLIGGKLFSYLNVDIIALCNEHKIRFVFLPPNNTHLTQPLDVCFF